MNNITVDTHKVFNYLQTKGYSEEQAEGLVDTLREIDLGHLATKAELKEEIGKLKAKMDSGFSELRSEISAKHANTLMWIIPLFITQYVMIIGLKLF